MSNSYSNPTANAAIGAVDRELNQMRRKAAKLKSFGTRGG